ncbi:MAG: undecaprenyl-diphosphate phosphatase [Bacilli bacterium]
MNLINIIKYVILGVIQGFTEPIPVSSSGHLIIFKHLFNFDAINDINFEIIVNFGSFLAICFLFRKKIIKIIKDFFMYIKTKEKTYKENYNYAWLIVIGTIPAGIIGFLLKDYIDLISNNIKLIGLALLITALALFLIKDAKGKKGKKEITILDSVIIGLFQVIALFPGISRSGATIVGGMSRNLKRETAVNYSFMLYLPISVATMILGVKELLATPNINIYIMPYTLGMIASCIITYFSAKWFIDVMKKGKLWYFVVYCIIVGILTLAFL